MAVSVLPCRKFYVDLFPWSVQLLCSHSMPFCELLERDQKGKICGIHRRWEEEVTEGGHRCFAVELGEKMGSLTQGNRGREKRRFAGSQIQFSGRHGIWSRVKLKTGIYLNFQDVKMNSDIFVFIYRQMLFSASVSKSFL